MCAGKQINVGVNDLASRQPKLVEEWDYEKNSKLPTEYTEHSNKKVFWKCKFCNYSWQAEINQRVQGKYKCPKCRKK